MDTVRKTSKGKLDPVIYEILKHKLWQILWEGRETMLRVSGSPVVSEAKECMFALHNAKGETVDCSAGLLLHVIGCEEMIKNITEWYSEEPGIYDGDVFLFNDAYVGGAHNPDMACLSPLFHQGQIVAWLTDLTHTPEVGAIEPGGQCPSATEIFHEGLRLPGLKLMERGVVRRDTYKLLERSVRDPVGIVLDCRAKVAGLNVGKRRMLELIQKYGLEAMNELFERIVEDSETSARAKLRELPNGTWTQIVYLDHDGKKDNLMRIQATVTKEADELTIDFTGTAPQAPGPTNCALPATWGSVFVAVCSLLFWEENWNHGLVKPIKLIAPEGTLVNARFPAAVNQAPGRPGIAIANALDIIFSKMFVTREKYYNDQNAAWYANNVCLMWGGRNQHGQMGASLLFDCLASGQGAGSSLDGCDAGCFQMTPEVIRSDIEIQETIHPWLYLTSRIAVDSGGPGKYRGGAGTEMVYMLHNVPEITMLCFGNGRLASYGPGLYGGYPASASRVVIAKDTNVKEWFSQQRAPYTVDDILKLEGDVKDYRPMVPATQVKENTIVYFYQSPGGGYGDPIDRAPEAVLKDVIDGFTSMEYAKNLYGVIIDPDNLTLNVEATKAQREQIRADRRNRATIGGKHEDT